jgi:hypothetical protein
LFQSLPRPASSWLPHAWEISPGEKSGPGLFLRRVLALSDTRPATATESPKAIPRPGTCEV